MKKNYLLILMFCYSFLTIAQDLRVTFNNYTSGENVNGSGPLSFISNFTVFNDDNNTILAGTSIGFGYRIAGYHYSYDGRQNSFSIGVTGAPLAQGEMLYVDGNGISVQPTNNVDVVISALFQAEVCAFAYAQNALVLDPSFSNDLTPGNNIICFTYSGPLGIEKHLNQLTDKMYVSNDYLTINSSTSYNSPVAISFVDIAGKLVKKNELLINQGENKIDLSDLLKGLYIVSLEREGQVVTKKMMIH